MALCCFLRSFPKSFQVCARPYITTSQLVKTSTALCSIQFKKFEKQPTHVQHKITCALPLLQKLSCNVQQLKPFSVSSKLQSHESENHTKLWSAERVVAAGLVGILPAAFIIPCQPLDGLLAVLLVMHNHWGIEAVVVDYVRPILVGPVIPKIAIGLVYATSIATLVGLFYLIFNGCGLVNTIQLLWKL